MSDWDFLHDMHHDGFSPEQIADAASCGYNPAEWTTVCDDEDEVSASYSQAAPELLRIFESLVENAKSYHQLTGRYLQIWGELGELYAEIRYRIERHKPHTCGSDGKLGNDFVEIRLYLLKKTEGRSKSNALGISTDC